MAFPIPQGANCKECIAVLENPRVSPNTIAYIERGYHHDRYKITLGDTAVPKQDCGNASLIHAWVPFTEPSEVDVTKETRADGIIPRSPIDAFFANFFER